MVRLSRVEGFWMEDDAVEVAVRGAYLRDFGFEKGSKVVIEVTKGVITIKLIDEED